MRFIVYPVIFLSVAMAAVGFYGDGKGGDTLMPKQIALMYHDIKPGPKQASGYSVSREAFKEQMEAVSRLADKNMDVIVTFDDGSRSWTDYALGIMKEHGINGYFFVCSSYIRDGVISEAQIRELARSGMRIGSHTMTHRRMERLNAEELRRELKESKTMLEEITGDEVRYLSIPWGSYSYDVVRAAKGAGYKRVFSSDYGIYGRDAFVIGRIPVTADMGISEFNNIIKGRLDPGKSAFQRTKNFIKRICR